MKALFCSLVVLIAQAQRQATLLPEVLEDAKLLRLFVDADNEVVADIVESEEFFFPAFTNGTSYSGRFPADDFLSLAGPFYMQFNGRVEEYFVNSRGMTEPRRFFVPDELTAISVHKKDVFATSYSEGLNSTELLQLTDGNLVHKCRIDGRVRAFVMHTDANHWYGIREGKGTDVIFLAALTGEVVLERPALDSLSDIAIDDRRHLFVPAKGRHVLEFDPGLNPLGKIRAVHAVEKLVVVPASVGPAKLYFGGKCRCNSNICFSYYNLKPACKGANSK